MDDKLMNIDHRPKDVEMGKDVWRDYYTGQQLDANISIISYPGQNCIILRPFSFDGSFCIVKFFTTWCPCLHDHQPRPLLLRGLCPDSNLRTIDFQRGLWYSPHQLLSDIQQISYIGGMSTRIDYDKPMNKWILNDVISETSAESLALENTYVLGKHKWTIKNDNQRCHNEREEKTQYNEYNTELKLSGCNQGFTFDMFGTWEEKSNIVVTDDGEFTCDNGQCISMRYRCDHLHRIARIKVMRRAAIC